MEKLTQLFPMFIFTENFLATQAKAALSFLEKLLKGDNSYQDIWLGSLIIY